MCNFGSRKPAEHLHHERLAIAERQFDQCVTQLLDFLLETRTDSVTLPVVDPHVGTEQLEPLASIQPGVLPAYDRQQPGPSGCWLLQRRTRAPGGKRVVLAALPPRGSPGDDMPRCA